MDNEQPDFPTNDLQESTPGSSGPQRASGGMGVSSERTGPAGPDGEVTDGTKDTSEARPGEDDVPREDLPPEQRPDVDEQNPVGIEPKAGYPSLDPRSD